MCLYTDVLNDVLLVNLHTNTYLFEQINSESWYFINKAHIFNLSSIDMQMFIVEQLLVDVGAQGCVRYSIFIARLGPRSQVLFIDRFGSAGHVQLQTDTPHGSPDITELLS